MKKIFLFSIILTINLHAIEQPNSPLEPSSHATQAKGISLGCAVMITGLVMSTKSLVDSLNEKRFSGDMKILHAIGIGITLIGCKLHSKKTPFNNKEKGAMLASLGLTTSLLTARPALKNTHHLGIEHLTFIAGIIGASVGVKVYNTDASKQVEEVAR